MFCLEIHIYITACVVGEIFKSISAWQLTDILLPAFTNNCIYLFAKHYFNFCQLICIREEKQILKNYFDWEKKNPNKSQPKRNKPVELLNSDRETNLQSYGTLARSQQKRTVVLQSHTFCCQVKLASRKDTAT